MLIISLGCHTDRSIAAITVEEKEIVDSYYQLQPQHQLTLVSDDEPGEPLILCLTFVGKADGSPLTGQRVHVYHTNATGDYQPADPGDESTARINGYAITDSIGRILVRTILPGDYGSSSDNRHIHTTVAGAHPEGYDIHFRQYSSFMGKRFIQGSDQHFLADLKRNASRELMGIITLEVKY